MVSAERIKFAEQAEAFMKRRIAAEAEAQAAKARGASERELHLIDRKISKLSRMYHAKIARAGGVPTPRAEAAAERAYERVEAGKPITKAEEVRLRQVKGLELTGFEPSPLEPVQLRREELIVREIPLAGPPKPWTPRKALWTTASIKTLREEYKPVTVTRKEFEGIRIEEQQKRMSALFKKLGAKADISKLGIIEIEKEGKRLYLGLEDVGGKPMFRVEARLPTTAIFKREFLPVIGRQRARVPIIKDVIPKIPTTKEPAIKDGGIRRAEAMAGYVPGVTPWAKKVAPDVSKILKGAALTLDIPAQFLRKAIGKELLEPSKKFLIERKIAAVGRKGFIPSLKRIGYGVAAVPVGWAEWGAKHPYISIAAMESYQLMQTGLGKLTAKMIGKVGIGKVGAGIAGQIASKVPSTAWKGYSVYMGYKQYRTERELGLAPIEAGIISTTWITPIALEEMYARHLARKQLAQLIPQVKVELAKGVKRVKPRELLPGETEVFIKEVKAGEVTLEFLKETKLSELLAIEKPKLVVGGSVAQRVQVFLKRLSADIDVYSAFPGLRAYQLAKRYELAGIEGVRVTYKKPGDIMEASSVWIKGMHAVSFHTKRWMAAFPFRYPTEVTPSGLKVIGVREQAFRKLEGLYKVGRKKDLPDFYAIVNQLGLKKYAEQVGFGGRPLKTLGPERLELHHIPGTKMKIVITKPEHIKAHELMGDLRIPKMGKKGTLRPGISIPKTKALRTYLSPPSYPIYKPSIYTLPYAPSYVPLYKPPKYPSYKPTYKPPYVPPYKPTYKPPYTPPYKPPYVPPYKPPYQPPYKPPYVPPYKPTYKPPYTPPYKPSKYTPYITPYKPPKYPSYYPRYQPPYIPPKEPPMIPLLRIALRPPKKKEKIIIGRPYRYKPTLTAKYIGKLPRIVRLTGLAHRPYEDIAKKWGVWHPPGMIKVEI